MSATLLELFKKVLTRKVFNSPKTCNLKAAYKLNGTTLEPGVDLRFHILFWSGIFESNHYSENYIRIALYGTPRSFQEDYEKNNSHPKIIPDFLTVT